MCLIIAYNLNVNSFSLKSGIFGKKAIFGQKWPFKENLLYLDKGKSKSKYVETKNLNLIKLHVLFLIIG
jgi:hypothetical protein